MKMTTYFKIIKWTVMKAKKNNRTKFISFRITPEEYLQISKKCKATTGKKISIYVRSILFEGKVTILTRDQSLDAFMTELIKLRNELSAIGNNYNQAVKRLHTYKDYPEVKLWLLFNETNQEILFKKIEQIKLQIIQFGESW